ncbi:unnamed protein product [Caenorhabditis angaria]|uniref:J domain-containing protein n=1 Tax=Caenorhabditis angaria TaxID=860376 RepID=A0A9P1MY02_9PELO|nr:unnamed protein product [Caenorhabditis angaria]
MYGILLRLFLIGVVYSSTDLELGNAFLAKGQLSDALSYFHEAINSDPKNYQAIYRRALTYLALSRPSSAFADFQKVLALKPDFVAAEQQKADILLKQGKLKEAEQIYQASSNTEKLDEIRRIQNHLDEVEHAFENGDYEVAEEMIAGIIENQKWNAELFKKRAKCAEMVGDFKKTVRNLKQLIKLSPDSTDVMYEVSQILYKIGNFDDSLKMIRECLKLNPDHKECFAFYKTIKKLVKGVDSVKSSIESQNWEECLKTAAKTVKSFENAKSALQILTLKCHRESGNNQQTILDATELLTSENPSEIETEILHHRALAYLEESEFDDAIQDVKKILENDPDDREFKELLRKAENAKVQAGKRDYYKILGVKRNAKKKEIVKAYRQLAQKWHPDNFKSEEEKKKAEKMFIDIAAAKEVLTDEEKREQFDNGIDPLDPEAAQNQQHRGHHGGFPHGFNPFGGDPFQKMEEQLANLDLNSNPNPEPESQYEIGWYDIPLELREIVLEDMTTDAKRRFSMCSKDCLKKVRRSKNFFKKISLFWTESIVEMEVSIGDDFYVIFQFSQDNEQVTECSIIGPIYHKTFKVVGDFHSVGLEYFQKFVEDAIHLENLELEVKNFPFDKVNIHHLKKLKDLRIKKAEIAEEDFINPFESGFLDFAQVSTVENSIRMENLNLAQVCELKARHIFLKNVGLSTENIEEYLKLWKNGELGENIQKVFMKTTEEINCEEILRDLETIGSYEIYDGKIWFKLRNLTGEFAEVSVSSNSVSMNLTILDDEDDFEYENLEDSEDEVDLENSEFLEAEMYRDFLNDNGFEFGDEDDDDFDDYIDPLYNY